MTRKNSTIKVGDVVNAIVWAWSEDETPTEKHFFTGKVKQLIRKGRGIVYVQIENLPKQVPADRVRVIA